jgi:aryl-alcohol dehydrogenase-like predicted oxidoreductase
MLPLCLDEGVGSIPWSPLARGRLARENDATTRGASTDSSYADLLYTQQASDRAIIDAVSAVARQHRVSRAQIALAWLRHKPVVVAPIIGASKASHLDDAVASLDIELTYDEIATLEAPYTPRADHQGISDPVALARLAASIGMNPAA